jgi:hypothetical protein
MELEEHQEKWPVISQSDITRRVSRDLRVRRPLRRVLDLGGVDSLLHRSEIPGAVTGMIGEKLSKGHDIEVEVLAINRKKRRIALRIPIDGQEVEPGA